jgi:putative transposase
LLTVNRSRFYHKPALSREESELTEALEATWMAMPFYGYRRLTAALRREGYVVNGKRTRRLMGEMGIQDLYPKPQTTVRCKAHKRFPYLLKGLVITHPNHVWCKEITYIKMAQGFGYVAALIDVYSRRVMGWRLSNTMDVGFCLEMLEEALQAGSPLILNTDQGSQFTSEAWVKRVQAAGISVSMDGKGRWADNVFIERFWRTLKQEHMRLHRFTDLREARLSIRAYIAAYNGTRLHQSLGYRTPEEVYEGFKKGMSVPQLSAPLACGYVDNAYALPHKIHRHNHTKTIETRREKSRLI